MPQSITITNEDILQCVKLYCQVPELLEKIITRKVIENTATEVGIKVDAEELQEAADKLRLMNTLKSAEDTWNWLKKYSLSLDDFEEMVYMNLIIDKLFRHFSFLDKAEPYFFENQLDYAGVIMYEIVLDDEDLALELFYAIRGNEMSFYDVAHQYIQDTELRRKGGYRGIVYRQDLQPEISAVVFAAKPPQVIKPVITSRGIHLILVEEIIRPVLDENLRHQIASELFDEWLKKQVSNFEIVNCLDDNQLIANTEK